ncbi:MAG: hypothetical protein NTY79_03190 [Chloroflexi bacterium]|nr:hypothetical protein [Chloroflexota bacterium]
MGWFKRHLNWTWGISFLLWFCLLLIQAIVPFRGILLLITGTIDSFILFPAWIVASVWVLKKKGRSLWWLILTIYGSPLWLSNKSKDG